MNKVMVFGILAIMAVLLLDYNKTNDEAKRLQDALREAVLSTESDANETVIFTEGEEYKVGAIKITVPIGKEFILQNLTKCGKYFYTIRKKNKTYIGFQIPFPDTTTDARRIQRNYLKGKYRVIPVYYDYPSPTVEFDNSEIIVRMNKIDLQEASCFREHTII